MGRGPTVGSAVHPAIGHWWMVSRAASKARGIACNGKGIVGGRIYLRRPRRIVFVGWDTSFHGQAACDKKRDQICTNSFYLNGDDIPDAQINKGKQEQRR